MPELVDTSAPSTDLSRLDLEKAEFPDRPAGPGACSRCQRPVFEEYWQLAGRVLCGHCRKDVERFAADANTTGLLRAALYGGAVALGAGVVYAMVVGRVHGARPFAIVGFAIAWLVGRAIQRATGGFGGKRHQVLAVVLTYCSSTMGYVPLLYAEMTGGHKPVPASVAPATSAASEPPASPPDEAVFVPSTPEAKAGMLVFAWVLSLGAPLLVLAAGLDGVITLAVTIFALRTAWRVSKGIGSTFTGPHRVSPWLSP